MQIGPYTIERELGRGGMGAVYLGRESSAAPPVAVKVIHADLSLDEDSATRFEREGAALERLDHPNLVALRRRGSYRGGHWLAMDFVQGDSLAELLKRKGPWSSHAARELLVSLCAGIAYAHEAGVLHRDLKPANVLIRALDGRALIADFGLALPLDLSQHLTRTGEILGSPGYLAPEQCGLGLPMTPATDVYGLGALLYCVLTGQPPIQGASLLGMLDKVLNEAPQPPSQLAPNLDPDLETICLRCLAKDPSERYPDARALQAALQAAPTAPQEQGSSRAPALALGLLLAGVGLSLAWFGRASEPDLAARATPSASPPTRPSLPDAPATPAPIASGTAGARGEAFEAALAARDWARARTLLAPDPDLDGCWQAYRLLQEELSWTGNETPEWEALKVETVQRVVKLEPQDPRTRHLGQGLAVALAALGDERLKKLNSNDPSGASRALERALDATSVPQRRAALWRALTLFRLYGSASDAHLLEAIRGWEEAAGASWETALARCKAAGKRSDQEGLIRALRQGELASYRDAPSWARYEFFGLRSRIRRQPTKTNAILARAILASEAPASLKSRSAMTLASSVVRDEGDPRRAEQLLRDHPPHPRSEPAYRAACWQAHAATALAAGDVARLRALLEVPALRPTGNYPRHLMRVCAHALLAERDAALRTLDAKPRPAEVASFILVLELQTAVLIDRRDWALTTTRRLLARQDLDLLLRAIEAVEAILDLRAPGGERALLGDKSLARAVGAEINRALRPQRYQLSKSLVEAGRWESAIELLLRLYDPKDPPLEDERTFRGCYRALRRGLEETPPSSREWQAALHLVRRLAIRVRSSKSRGTLLALLESLEEVSAEREAELAQSLGSAARAQPQWEELYMAYAMLRKRATLRRAPETRYARRARSLRAVREWAAAFPSSPTAHVEYLVQARPKNVTERLQALLKQVPRTHPVWWRAQTSLIQARYLAGQLSDEDFRLNYAGVLSSSGDPLPRARRAALLLLAAGYPASEAAAPDRRRVLDWLVATTGPLEPSTDLEDALLRGRYLLLRAQVARALGKPEEALAISETLSPYPPETPDAVRAEAERLRAELELELGRAGGLDRLRRSVETHPSQEGLRVLARHTTGAERLEALERALCYGGEAAPELMREIAASGADPLASLQRCLPILEEVDSTQPEIYAAALFAERRDPARALLLLEALRIQELKSPEDAKRFREEQGPLLAAALALLPEETQSLFRAQDALRAALVSGVREEIRRSFEPLRRFETTPLSDRLRVPLTLTDALNHSALGPNPELAERTLASYLERGTAPNLIRIWRAESSRARGELEVAREAARAGLARVERAPPATRARYLFQAAMNAAAGADDARALKLLGESLATAERTPEVVAAHLAQAQLRLRRGEPVAASDDLQIAVEYCPPERKGLRLQLLLTSCRIDLAAGRVPEARGRLQHARASPELARASPRVRALAKALEAAVLNAEEAHKQALEVSDEAIRLYERGVPGYLARLDALVGLGEREAAEREARQLLASPKLTHGGKSEITDWLARLRRQGR